MGSKKPKLLYVVQNLSGGVLTYLINLTERLLKSYDIAIAFSPDAESPKDMRSLFSSSIPMARIETFEKEGNLLKESIARGQLRDIVNKEKPDIVHMHGYKAGKIGRKALDGMGIPLFYTPHGYLYLAETHNILSRSLYRSNEQSAARTDCMTIACSKGEFAETLGLTDNAVYVNNGLDTQVIDGFLEGLKEEDHPFTVFTIGRINKQKNPDLFNEIAMAMPDVRFVWIGDGMYKYKLVAPNIEVTGWLSREETIRRAFGYDVFILTSLWEGLPISLLEAMYLKKLCIVNNVVGSRDVITNGENGYVVNSAASYVNAIHHAKDPQAAEMIEHAYNDIVQHYSVDHMASEYDRIYQEALQSR